MAFVIILPRLLLIIGIFSLDTSHDSTLEPKAQTDGDTLAKGGTQDAPVILEIEFCQEAQATQRKTQDGRDNALEQPACVKDSPVSSQCDDKVEHVWSRLAHEFIPVFEASCNALFGSGQVNMAAGGVGRGHLVYDARHIKLLVRLELVLYVDDVLDITLLVQEPLCQFSGLWYQVSIVDLGKKEDCLDAESNLHAAQPSTKLAHAPGHVAQLLLGEHATVNIIVRCRIHLRRRALGHLVRPRFLVCLSNLMAIETCVVDLDARELSWLVLGLDQLVLAFVRETRDVFVVLVRAGVDGVRKVSLASWVACSRVRPPLVVKELVN